ncbi:hypothetical protein ACTHQY_14940 [Rhodococcoides corynebacterioides]|uniref:hypothetical protein n=1 Tax=Rhodococcoides corynebacterioides TaxID=53972 RepID=UPI003F7D4F26
MTAFPDVLALLCAQLPPAIGDVRCVTDLHEHVVAPIVQLAEIPGGGALHKPFNGPPLTEQYDVDVVVFGDSTVPDAVGRTRDLAQQVRDVINAWSSPGVTVDERRRPTRLPDFNPSLLRFGSTVRFTAARVP